MYIFCVLYISSDGVRDKICESWNGTETDARWSRLDIGASASAFVLKIYLVQRDKEKRNKYIWITTIMKQ